jgi:hypothetical protein
MRLAATDSRACAALAADGMAGDLGGWKRPNVADKRPVLRSA